MKITTLISYKGGVGKTTSCICLSSLFSQYGKTLLIDSDPNRSATTWARSGKLPFEVCNDKTAPKVMGKNQFDFVVIDTPARPTEDELHELAEGCDLMIVPSTPDSLSLDAMALMIQGLPKTVNYHILLTMLPPAPQKDGVEALQALKENSFPVIGSVDGFKGIRAFKLYKEAVTAGVPIYSVREGKKAWRDWTELAKLSPLKELLASVPSSSKRNL